MATQGEDFGIQSMCSTRYDIDVILTIHIVSRLTLLAPNRFIFSGHFSSSTEAMNVCTSPVAISTSYRLVFYEAHICDAEGVAVVGFNLKLR